MSWVRLDDQFPDHPKVAGLSNDAFCLHVTAMCWTAKQQTDGKLPSNLLSRLAWRCQDPAMAKDELIAAGVWEVDPAGGWNIHDYGEYNPTKANSEELSAMRSEAGKAGAAKRWQNHSKSDGKPHGKTMAPSPSPITESNSGMSEYVSSSSNGKGHDDDLIDPEVTAAIGKWKETFAKTPWEGNPPVEKFHRWLAFGGPDVLCHMIGQASGKDNPAGWLYTTYDNWRKDGEVAPHIARQVADKRAESAPLVTKTVTLDFGDGIFEDREVQVRG